MRATFLVYACALLSCCALSVRQVSAIEATSASFAVGELQTYGNTSEPTHCLVLERAEQVLVRFDQSLSTVSKRRL